MLKTIKTKNIMQIICVLIVIMFGVLISAGCADVTKYLRDYEVAEQLRNINMDEDFTLNITKEDMNEIHIEKVIFDRDDNIRKVLVQDDSGLTYYYLDDDNSFMLREQGATYLKIKMNKYEAELKLKDFINYNSLFFSEEVEQNEIYASYGLKNAMTYFYGKEKDKKRYLQISASMFGENKELYNKVSNLTVKDNKIENIYVSLSYGSNTLNDAYKGLETQYTNLDKYLFDFSPVDLDIPQDFEENEYKSCLVQYNSNYKFKIDDQNFINEMSSCGDKIVLQNVMQNDEFTFNGWYYDKDFQYYAGQGGEEIILPYSLNHITLFAKGEAKANCVKVKIDLQSGGALFDTTISCLRGTKLIDVVNLIDINDIYNPVKKFVGFYLDKTGETSIANQICENETIIYAVWEDLAKIVLHLGDKEILPILYLDIGEDLYLSQMQIPSKEGQIFAGWYYDKEFSKQFTGVEDIEEINLFAKMLPANTLKINMPKCKNIMPSFVSFTDNITKNNLENMIKELFNTKVCTDYSFGGIYLDEELKNEFTEYETLINQIYIKCDKK